MRSGLRHCEKLTVIRCAWRRRDWKPSPCCGSGRTLSLGGSGSSDYFRGVRSLRGAIYAVAGVVTGLLAKHFGLGIWTDAGRGLASALLLNGLLVTTTKINSFIATPSTMMVYRGIAMVLSQGPPHPMKLMFSWD
jgi:hypothetical protein